jgi:hypothetical protein
MTVTEADWLAITDVECLLSEVRKSSLMRKHFLFGAACSRLVWGWLCDTGRELVCRVEGVNGPLSRAEVDDWSLVAAGQEILAYAGAWTAHIHLRWFAAQTVVCTVVGEYRLAMGSAALALQMERAFPEDRDIDTVPELELAPDARVPLIPLLRCVYGNPYRSLIVCQPDWRTSVVSELIRRIDSDREAQLYPILADALQDAGCDHPHVLAHCRGGGPHVRGCWVVDLLLGKG